MFKKVKLVISGSGTRYPIQLGAIIRLLELGIEIEEVVGTSGGAICAAAIGSGYDRHALLKLATSTLPKNILEKNWLPFGGTKSIYNNKKLLKTFRQLFVEDFSDCEIPTHIVTHNWTKKEPKIWNGPKDDLPLATNASMCLPIFDMVEINGELYEDGGIDANFCIDFQDWNLKNNTPVIGIRMRSDGYTLPRKKPFFKTDRLIATISDLIDACDREHIEDATWAKVVTITTNFPGVKLDIDEKDVIQMINEGKNAINAALIEGKLG